MYAKKTTLLNKTGLHARPASIFVNEASKFSSDITINRLDEDGEISKSCPAKSIVYLLTMKLSRGTEIELVAEGADEQQAIDTLVDLIETGFGEM